MNKKIGCFLIALTMLYAAPVLAFESSVQLKILPYIEAEGELDSRDGDYLLIWSMPDKVLFGTFANSYFDQEKYCASENPRSECKKPTFERTKKIRIFDFKAKKTRFDQNDQFYPKQLEAFYRATQHSAKSSCPNDDKDFTRILAYPLKPEHGCIRVIRDDMYSSGESYTSFTYVRADGKQIHLTDRPYDDNLGFSVWIEWLGAYVLRQYNSLATTSNGNGSSSIISESTALLLSPKGDLKAIELNEHSFRSARPTRAGMLAITYPTSNKAGANEYTGLTLWREGKRYKIVDADHIGDIEVAPDGCKVAYFVARPAKEMLHGVNGVGLKGEYIFGKELSKLRVMDVCEGFHVSKKANPFKFN